MLGVTMRLRYGPREYPLGNQVDGCEAWGKNEIKTQAWELVETMKLSEFAQVEGVEREEQKNEE